MNLTTQTGNRGEDLIAQWLTQTHQARLLDRHWTCRMGELDLVAQFPDGTIAFIEVKTRSPRNWDQDGLLALSTGKQRKLVKTAQLYLLAHPNLADAPCRFDVAIVALKQGTYSLKTYIQNAFEAP
ncbi:MAG: YraN family protein [Alkalinema sp. RU_4_3]|nr:YraN family protein [Alkalinema sp. RU_4_3]